MNAQLRDRFCDLTNLRHMSKIQSWVNALTEHIHGHRDQVTVTGSFAIAK